MKIKTSRLNRKFKFWGITKFVSVQNTGIDDRIDNNEYLVESGSDMVLVSPKPMMVTERLNWLGVTRYFQLPRQAYEFLDWGRNHGDQSNKYRMVVALPLCEIHLANMEMEVPAPFICKTTLGMKYLCPECALNYQPVEVLFVEE